MWWWWLCNFANMLKSINCFLFLFVLWTSRDQILRARWSGTLPLSYMPSRTGLDKLSEWILPDVSHIWVKPLQRQKELTDGVCAGLDEKCLPWLCHLYVGLPVGALVTVFYHCSRKELTQVQRNPPRGSQCSASAMSSFWGWGELNGKSACYTSTKPWIQFLVAM